MFNRRRIFIAALILAIFSFAACGDEESGTDESLNVTEPGDSDADGDAEPDGDADPDGDGEPDPDPVTCESNSECESDEFCDRAPGCGDPGTCEARDIAGCGEVEVDYCDCNGDQQTSPTECIQDPYDYVGICEVDRPEYCDTNADCTEAGEYCEREFGCGAPGTCEPIPQDQGCGDAETPYCDCNGVMQVSPDTCVWAPSQELSACESAPKEGCELNEHCEMGEYCEREPGCEEPGECTAIPTDVMCTSVVTPYCDCEGNQQQSPTGCIYDAYMNTGSCTM